MKLKDIILQDFLSSDKNFSIYGTNFNELGSMYEKVITSIKSGESFERFLQFENALTSDGKIKFDMTTDYYDKDTKKNIKTKVVFKYAVYNFIHSKYITALTEIKKKETLIPLPQ